jgi:transposase-like protein
MFKQIRTLMSEDISLEGEAVEMDETYVGGLAKNMHAAKRKKRIAGTGGVDKTTVFGMVERGGRVVAKVTKDAKSATLFPIVQERVMPSSTVYTDTLPVYDRLSTKENGYVHHRINHTAKVYVMGDVHTNTIEGFWKLIEKGNRGRIPSG